MTVPPKTKAALSSWLKNYLHRKARLSGRSIESLCGDIAIYAKTDSFLYVLDEEKREYQIGRVLLPRSKEELEQVERERAVIKTGHKPWMTGQIRHTGLSFSGQAAKIGGNDAGLLFGEQAATLR